MHLLQINGQISIGNAQSAIHQRDKVFRAIDHWVRNFKKVAQVALEDDPQLL